jgi:phage gp37-like protein
LQQDVLASSSGMVSSNTLTTVSATDKANFIALIDKSQMDIFDRIRRLNEKPMQSLSILHFNMSLQPGAAGSIDEAVLII